MTNTRMEPTLDKTLDNPITPPAEAERPKADLVSGPLDLAKIRSRLETQKGQAYWRSLEELAETPEFSEFVAKEFPRQAAPLAGSVDRRGFMKLLGASLALAGLTSCVRPYQQEKIVPYVKAPEELIPGEPIYFASALTQGGYATGVLVESQQGRPTKIEGNPDHPASLGSSSAQMQAAPLALYDPDRSQFVLNGGAASSYGDFAQVLGTTLQGLGDGTGFYILSETVTSPTLARQLAALLTQFPKAQWHQFDGLTGNSVAGSQLAFGEQAAVRYDFSKADIVLSLGSDFLGSGPGQIAYSRAFSERRRVRGAEDTMNRVYVLESGPTVTGSMADHRLALRPSQITAAAYAIAANLGVEGVERSDLPEGLEQAWLDAVSEDLNGAKGRCVVVAGDEQSPSVHVLVAAINELLGNVGETVIYTEPVAVQPLEQVASLKGLTDAMNGAQVQFLLILGGNPVYSAPSDLAFADALAKVPLSVHHSLYVDETSSACTWHVPATHDLETWSDARAFDGTVSIMQPLIEPFYNGFSVHEVLSAALGDTESTPYDVVRATYENQVDGDFETFWRQSVYKGALAGTQLGAKALTLQANAISQAGTSAQASASAAAAALAAADARRAAVVANAVIGNTTSSGGSETPVTSPEADGLEVAFQLDPSILDGRYSNNGWLQELPNPFTKLTWDNAALIAPALAEREGLSNGDMVAVTVADRSLELPVWLNPGQADNLIVLHLGYGRRAAGHVGNGLGFNVNTLRASDTLWHATGAQLRATGKTYTLVSTQMHHALDTDGVENRHIVRHGTLTELQAEPEHPHFVHPVEHPESNLYAPYTYEGYAWGMVVDMNVCTGCNACVTACQAENNIPIVGKGQVQIGREMQWIRVDAYYGGDVDDPSFYHMPMMCQHCEQAPCEPVCPVGATTHDSEGLNVMVYNRCVGTRYCSNNCPYKVRRFNFLQYAELDDTSLAMLANPNVTVRSRGVMEKCTYCVQRIKASTIRAGNENRQVRDGEIVTACQSACPTQAIVFGDINNPESAVSAARGSVLNYAVLTELNTAPRTSYLTKLTNPHPALAETHAEAEAAIGAH